MNEFAFLASKHLLPPALRVRFFRQDVGSGFGRSRTGIGAFAASGVSGAACAHQVFGHHDGHSQVRQLMHEASLAKALTIWLKKDKNAERRYFFRS